MALPAYPTEIAPEDWAVVTDALTGKIPDPRHAAHVLYNVEGYILGKFYADPTGALPNTEHALMGLPAGGTWLQLLIKIGTVLLQIAPLIAPFLGDKPPDPSPAPATP